MGIEKFHTYIREVYFRAILEYNNLPYDHIYIDLNYILHKHIAYVLNEEHLISRVIENINHIIATNPPLISLNLFSDGSASFAKILLQKSRRIQMMDCLQKNKLNPLILTTGTPFMNTFNQKMKQYVTSLKNETLNNVVINFSFSDEFGESEFKIAQHITKNTKNIYDTHLIFSNDSDIILISMAQRNIFNIYVVVQQNKYVGTYIVSINLLIEQIMDEYGYNLNKRHDFVLLSLLNGNDYFPKMKYVNNDKLWYAYKKSIQKYQSIVCDTNEINVQLFIKFLKTLFYSLPNNQRNVLPYEISDNTAEYLQGLQWCVSLYSSGITTVYDYIYTGESIHPFSCLIKLLVHKNIQKLTENINIDISSDIYSVLVLPYSSKRMIPTKYHNIIENELQYMYDEELCTICKKFKEHSGCRINKCSCTGKCKYSSDKYITHKKSHTIHNPKEYMHNIIKKLQNI